MAFDFFLKLDGIKGESIDDKHKDEIQLESFSWGAQSTGSDGGAGSGAGHLSLQDFSFTAKVGVQSPQLFRALADTKHIRTGTLTVTHGKQSEFLVITMRDILVASYKESVAVPVVQCDRDDQKANSDNAPIESVSLNFQKIEFNEA